MISISHLILDHHVLGYSSIQDYIADKHIDQASAGGTDIEMLALAHLLQTPMLSVVNGRDMPHMMWRGHWSMISNVYHKVRE